MKSMSQKGLGILFILSILLLPATADAGWYSSSWKYRKTITIDSTKVAATLSNFPVLISMTDTDLRDDAQSDGDDILFTPSDGTTKLSHEIELFDGTTGQLVAWVKIPSLSSSSDTVIYMYYGNSGASSQQDAANVWDSSLKMVQHLKESPGGTAPQFQDSTSSNNDGTTNGNLSQQDAKIGKGIYFDGSYDWIQVPHSSSLVASGNQLTLSAWVKSTVDQNDDAGIIVKSDGSNYNMNLNVQGSDKGNFRVRTTSGSTYLTGSTVLTQNQWYFLYGIYNGSTAKVYLNTSEDGTANNSGNIISPTEVLVIGRRTIGDNRFFQGVIDEARLAYTARSTQWMNTEYNNQNSPSTFYSVGSETPVVEFAASSSSGSEGTTPANLEVSLSGSTGQNVTVDYAVTGGTATGSGTDYTLASGTATITAGNTSTNISITIVDDAIYEGNETIQVTLSNPSNAYLGSTTVHTFTINDNDGQPTVQFTAASSSGSESTTPASIGISLSNPSTQNVTVDYAVTGGTATGSGTDYTLASGTATITAGNTTTNVSATIVDDSLDEANETIIVTISNPTNATLGTNTAHTYTITDNDATPSVQFTATSSSDAESVTPANLELTLSAASGQDVTVDYAVTGGTATGSGTDYTLASGTATITAGNTTTNVSATIVDDSTGEANETIIVTISNPSGATLGTNTTHTYTINDNDASKLGFNQQPSNQAAGSAITPAVTVQILDTNNNLITSATNSVTIAIGTNPGSGTLSGTTTVSAVSGVATFNDLSINKAGTGYTLAATSSGLTGDTSDTFNITSASALYLKVTGTATMTAGTTNELTTTAYDSYDNVATGYTGAKNLTFSGPSSAPDGTIPTVEGINIGSATSVTFTDGVSNSGAATLTAYKAESTTVDVSDGSLHSNGDVSYDLDLTVSAASAATLSEVSGNSQSGMVGSTLSDYYVAKVVDSYQNPVSGTSVSWSITDTPSGASGQSLSSTSTTTDSNGRAQSQLTLGNTAGTYTVQASSGSLTGSPASFTATANAASSTTMAQVSGNCQTGSVSMVLPSPFVIKVTDDYDNPISGGTVSWEVKRYPYGSTGASVSSATSVTDTNGQAWTTLTLGDKAGYYKVEASCSGLSGSPIIFGAFTGNSFFLKGNGYAMTSAPYTPSNVNAEAVFDELGAYNPAYWRLFRYNGSAYYEYPSTPDITPGKGYWIITSADTTIAVSGTEPGSEVTVTLQPGWNQIGGAFTCPIPWTSVVSRNQTLFDNGTITNVLWGYDAEFAEHYLGNALEPWQGYWIYNASGSAVDFVIPTQ